MKYLYGDSTPFPLAENFLVTARAAIETCIALLRADECAAQGRSGVRDAEARATQELTRLEALARRVEDGFGAATPSGSEPSPTEVATARIAELARVQIDQSRAEVLRWKDAAVAAAARDAPLGRVLPALGAFLSKHQLPNASWSLRWGAGYGSASAKAEAYVRTPCGLESILEVEVPRNHLWARPVRVSSLDTEAVIHLCHKPWFGRPRLEPERLGRLHVTAISHMPEHAAIRLGESARGPSRGIEVVLRSPGSTQATATRIDVDGAALGQPEPLRAEDSLVVQRLWSRIEATVYDLICYRKVARTAALRGTPVDDLVHPAVIAEAIIDSIAPVIREIARRSTPGELGLKRYLGDGRREEVFIPYEALLAGTEELQPRHRTMFDAFGLREARGATVHLLPAVPRLPKLRAVND